jgi:AraC-like DNA-binding protein
MPITDVALEAGYADLSNFVRTFHREIGCPPGAYRAGRGSKILQARSS